MARFPELILKEVRSPAHILSHSLVVRLYRALPELPRGSNFLPIFQIKKLSPRRSGSASSDSKQPYSSSLRPSVGVVLRKFREGQVA